MKAIAKSERRNYSEILDAFGGRARSAADCTRHLVSLGFSQGQARNAVFRYRRSNRERDPHARDGSKDGLRLG
jgi:hypothetical protein